MERGCGRGESQQDLRCPLRYCNTSTRQAEVMRAHLSAIHLGYNPFGCHPCISAAAVAERYPSRVDLEQHHNSVHPQREFSMLFERNRDKETELLRMMEVVDKAAQAKMEPVPDAPTFMPINLPDSTSTSRQPIVMSTSDMGQCPSLSAEVEVVAVPAPTFSLTTTPSSRDVVPVANAESSVATCARCSRLGNAPVVYATPEQRAEHVKRHLLVDGAGEGATDASAPFDHALASCFPTPEPARLGGGDGVPLKKAPTARKSIRQPVTTATPLLTPLKSEIVTPIKDEPPPIDERMRRSTAAARLAATGGIWPPVEDAAATGERPRRKSARVKPPRNYADFPAPDDTSDSSDDGDAGDQQQPAANSGTAPTRAEKEDEKYKFISCCGRVHKGIKGYRVHQTTGCKKPGVMEEVRRRSNQMSCCGQRYYTQRLLENHRKRVHSATTVEGEATAVLGGSDSKNRKRLQTSAADKHPPVDVVESEWPSSPPPSPPPSDETPASEGSRRIDAAIEAVVVAGLAPPQPPAAVRRSPVKAKQRTFYCCSVCQDHPEVSSNEMNRHVFEVHIAEPLVRCPLGGCHFALAFDEAVARAHVKEEHPRRLSAGADIIDERMSKTQELTDWTRRCFPSFGVSSPAKKDPPVVTLSP